MDSVITKGDSAIYQKSDRQGPREIGHGQNKVDTANGAGLLMVCGTDSALMECGDQRPWKMETRGNERGNDGSDTSGKFRNFLDLWFWKVKYSQQYYIKCGMMVAPYTVFP